MAIRCQSLTDVRIGEPSAFGDGQGMGDGDSILDLEQMICEQRSSVTCIHTHLSTFKGRRWALE
jgi:hypothetical protein